jgi:hypothetical protein
MMDYPMGVAVVASVWPVGWLGHGCHAMP